VLTDPRQLKIVTGISERDQIWIEQGAQAIVTSPLIPNKEFPARVLAISQRRSDKNQNYPMELRLDNPNMELKAGMAVNIRIKGKKLPNIITLPVDYIVDRDNKWYVYVVDGDKVTAREVRLGERSGEDVIILSGLKEGESIAIDNIARLKDGTKIVIKGGSK